MNYAVPGTEAMHAVIELKFDLARDHDYGIEGLVRHRPVSPGSVAPLVLKRE